MKKTRKKPPFYDLFHFDEIWSRIISETPIRKYKELCDIIGNTPQNITKRKDENYFPPDWAFYVGIKFNLSTEWILMGKGPKNLKGFDKDNYFSELEKWGKEIGKSENLEWMTQQIDQTFPMFVKWRKRKEEGEISSSETSNSKIA